ncbi:MAG TPA: hypothetical protein VKP11_02230 [Frankiaceae bacterium]|nr:hypothetical protein [Frankiaceae bacterium]
MMNGIGPAPRSLAWWTRAAGARLSGADGTLLAARTTSATDASIGIATDDGDTVTISLSTEAQAAYAWYRRDGTGGGTALAASASRETGITVRGRLDQEELSDIARLVARLLRSVRSVLKGNVSAAVHQALGGPSLDTLAGFTLGVTHSESLSLVAAAGGPIEDGGTASPDPVGAPIDVAAQPVAAPVVGAPARPSPGWRAGD